MVRECNLTFDQVRELNLYERLMLMGYVPKGEKAELLSDSQKAMPAGQKKRAMPGYRPPQKD